MANKFKLQPVLKHRGLLEDQARQRLAESLDRERTLLGEVALAREALASLHEELLHRQGHGIGVQDLLLYESHIAHRGKLLRELDRRRTDLLGEIDERRNLLCHASREKKLLEKLKEKDAAEYRRLEEQAETVELDEIALQSRGRKL